MCCWSFEFLLAGFGTAGGKSVRSEGGGGGGGGDSIFLPSSSFSFTLWLALGGALVQASPALPYTWSPSRCHVASLRGSQIGLE